MSGSEITRLYAQEKQSTTQIAKALGISIYQTRKALKAEGVQLRTKAEGIRLRPDRGAHLKGKRRVLTPEHRANIVAANRARAESAPARGVSLKPNGYLEFTRGPHKGRLVHVVAMEQSIGRRIQPGECVHHVDENKQNNALENLRLLTLAEHSRIHRLQEVHNRKRDENGRFC